MIVAEMEEAELSEETSYDYLNWHHELSVSLITSPNRIWMSLNIKILFLLRNAFISLNYT